MATRNYIDIIPAPFRPPMISPTLIHDIDTPTGHALAISLLTTLTAPNLIGLTITRSSSPPASSEHLNSTSPIRNHHLDVLEPQPPAQTDLSSSTTPSSIPTVDLSTTPYLTVLKHCTPVTTVLIHTDPVRYVEDHSTLSYASMTGAKKEVIGQRRQLEDCKAVLSHAENLQRVIMFGRDERKMAIVGELLYRWIKEYRPEITVGRMQQKVLQAAVKMSFESDIRANEEDVNFSEFIHEQEDDDEPLKFVGEECYPEIGFSTQVYKAGHGTTEEECERVSEEMVKKSIEESEVYCAEGVTKRVNGRNRNEFMNL